MNDLVRCVAVDYDGTLTADGPVTTETAAAVRRARADGVAVVLVTGRILSELVAVDPAVVELVDAVVAENGAVLHREGTTRRLVPPVDPVLERVARERGAVLRSGEVILAGAADDRAMLGDVVAELGLDVHLVANRSELMAVPAGVTKATGLRHALDVLGRDRHQTIAIGDAENDLAMLADCELGVAVANAVDSVRARADVITHGAAGAGVTEILDGVARSPAPLRSRRWQLVVGTEPATDRRVTVPAAGVNLLVSGPSGSGKSYVAGLLIEQLVDLGYAVFVVDPEGDHGLLGELGDVTTIGGAGPFPTPPQIGELLVHGPPSLVVDLSQHAAGERVDMARELPTIADAARRETGRPHWVVLDEAHLALEGPAAAIMRNPQRGHLLVTYQPERLPPEVRAELDGEIRVLADRGDADAELRVPYDGPPTPIRFVRRATRHVRHWHKYCSNPLAPELGFHFRDGAGHPTGAVARCLADFAADVAVCGDDVIEHHAAGGEFSRWIGGVFRDHDLAATVAAAEAVVRRAGSTGVAAARAQLLDALASRRLTGSHDWRSGGRSSPAGRGA